MIASIKEVGNITYNLMGFGYEVMCNAYIMYIVYMIG